MKTLETNDWMVLNNIIYKIHTTENFDEMRKQLLEQLKVVLDFDSADFYLVSPKSEDELYRPVGYNCDPEEVRNCKEQEWGLSALGNGKSMVYRETDILSDDKRVVTPYYKKVYQANNWHYAIRMVLGRNRHFLGVITLYRTIGKENFVYDDVFALDMLKDHLAYRMEKIYLSVVNGEEKITIEEAVRKYELTKREKMILSYLIRGEENQAICDELNISINTIKKHILNIYRKLGIRNRVQLFKMICEG